MHSGRFTVVAGKPLDEGLLRENLPAVEEGSCNLQKQIENMRLFGIPVVVAINQFEADTQKEIDLVKRLAKKAGAWGCQVSRVWAEGSKGGRKLARLVSEASQEKADFKFLYPLDISIKEKIHTIATKVYGASHVEYSEIAEKKVELFTKKGYDRLSICMAKTHLSLSHDVKLKGRPQGYALPIRDIRASVGAGFLYPLCGTMQTMPGLPSHPAGEVVDIDEKGRIAGLF
jgi:formyltetrahydrofolate synthetase